MPHCRPAIIMVSRDPQTLAVVGEEIGKRYGRGVPHRWRRSGCACRHGGGSNALGATLIGSCGWWRTKLSVHDRSCPRRTRP